MHRLQSEIAEMGFGNARLHTPREAEKIPRSAGSYVLFLELSEDVELEISGLPSTILKPGLYAYCGSANGPGGLQARLARHFRTDKKIHWHIDHLTTRTDHKSAIALPNANECNLVEILDESGRYEIPIPGFGSSDCKCCSSHLLRRKL